MFWGRPHFQVLTGIFTYITAWSVWSVRDRLSIRKKLQHKFVLFPLLNLLVKVFYDVRTPVHKEFIYVNVSVVTEPAKDMSIPKNVLF